MNREALATAAAVANKATTMLLTMDVQWSVGLCVCVLLSQNGSAAVYMKCVISLSFSLEAILAVGTALLTLVVEQILFRITFDLECVIVAPSLDDIIVSLHLATNLYINKSLDVCVHILLSCCRFFFNYNYSCCVQNGRISEISGVFVRLLIYSFFSIWIKFSLFFDLRHFYISFARSGFVRMKCNQIAKLMFGCLSVSVYSIRR